MKNEPVAALGPIRRLDLEAEEQKFLDQAALAALPYALGVQADEAEDDQDWLIIADVAAAHACDIADAMLAERRRRMEEKKP